MNQVRLQEYRVAILAAGAGSRLGAKAAKSHKALIRVGEKAVISHIIDNFPLGVTIVVGVGHNAHLIEEFLTTAYADRDFIFERSEYGPGFGPGYSLSKCQQHLQMPFFYFDCDTIIRDFEIDRSENWVACAEIKPCESSKYCTVLVNAETLYVSGFVDKATSGSTLAWTGSAFIKDYVQFWEALRSNTSLVRGEYQIAPALFSLSKSRARRVTWFDAGNESGLALAQEAFHTVGNLGRRDEEIYFQNGRVVKYYEDTIRLEKIASRMNSLKGVMPAIVRAGRHFLKYDYTPGTDMSRIVRLGDHIEAFLQYCEDRLWTRIELPAKEVASFEATCLRFYRDKTMARVSDAFSKLAICDATMSINGRETPPLIDLITNKVDWSLIANGLASRFHGDLNLSNVILSPDGTFTLVDCREEFAGELYCGDRYYDLAKIYQSFLLPHCSIRSKAYGLSRTAPHEIRVVIDIPEGVAKARNLFDDWAHASGYNLRKIQIISAMTLVNIAVLHDLPLTEHMLFYGWYCLDNFSKSPSRA